MITDEKKMIVELLCWAVKTEDRCYLECYGRHELSPQLLAAVEKAESIIGENYEQLFKVWTGNTQPWELGSR